MHTAADCGMSAETAAVRAGSPEMLMRTRDPAPCRNRPLTAPRTALTRGPTSGVQQQHCEGDRSCRPVELPPSTAPLFPRASDEAGGRPQPSPSWCSLWSDTRRRSHSASLAHGCCAVLCPSQIRRSALDDSTGTATAESRRVVQSPTDHSHTLDHQHQQRRCELLSCVRWPLRCAR